MATSFYQVKNYYLSSLKEELGTGKTTIVLDDETGLPTSYPFLLTIWDSTLYGNNPNLDPNMEIVEVTEDYVGDGYTIVRGKEDTSDVTHAVGSAVAMLLTAGIIKQIQDAINALE